MPDTIADTRQTTELMMIRVIAVPADEENAKGDELNTYLEEVMNAEQGNYPPGEYLRTLAQKDIAEVIDALVRNPLKSSSFARVLGRYSRLIVGFTLVLMLCGNLYFWRQTHEHELAVYSGEVLLVAGFWWLFKLMNRAAMQLEHINSHIISLYKFMTVYLAGALLFMGNMLASEFIDVHFAIVALCEIAIVVATVAALTVWDKKDLRGDPVQGEGLGLDVISDTDEALLCSNPFIKEWIDLAVERRDTLTYSLLSRSRASILKFADEVLILQEEQRIRKMIFG